MDNRDPLQGRDVAVMSGLRNVVSFVERIHVHSALAVAVLISLAWIGALTMLLKSVPPHSVKAESNPAAQNAAPALPDSSSK
jgi:hypothetical protein